MIAEEQITPGGGRFEEDGAGYASPEEKVNLTLSSGDEVDLSSLPVRVSHNEGDLPMETPKVQDLESIEGGGYGPQWCPTDSNEQRIKPHDDLAR